MATGALRLARSLNASQQTLPEQNTMRWMDAGSVTPGSSRTSRNEPSVICSTGLMTSFMRRGDLGANTTSGLRMSRRT